MSMPDEPCVIHGGCHCGALRVCIATALAPAGIVPRACDCSFCQKHGAAYVSDPAGKLLIAANGIDAALRYRQGSGHAQFVLCPLCGVLVAVLYAAEGHLFAAANARCIDPSTAFADAVPASPQQLAPAVRRSRWSQLWFADVTLQGV
jgi:hypothetical protein